MKKVLAALATLTLTTTSSSALVSNLAIRNTGVIADYHEKMFQDRIANIQVAVNKIIRKDEDKTIADTITQILNYARDANKTRIHYQLYQVVSMLQKYFEDKGYKETSGSNYNFRFSHAKLSEAIIGLLNASYENKYVIKNVSSDFAKTSHEQFRFQSAITRSLANKVPVIITRTHSDNANDTDILVVSGIDVDKNDAAKTTYRMLDPIKNIRIEVNGRSLNSLFRHEKTIKLLGDVEPFDFDTTQWSFVIKTKDNAWKAGNDVIKRKWNNSAPSGEGNSMVTNYAFNLLTDLGILYFDTFKREYSKIRLDDGFMIEFKRQFYNINTGFGLSDWAWHEKKKDEFEVKNITNGNRDWINEYSSGKVWKDFRWVSYDLKSSTKVLIENGSYYLFLQYYLTVDNSSYGDLPFKYGVDYGHSVRFIL